MNLDGACALVTGGASGLGLATSRRMLSAGAHVVVADLPGEERTEAVRELGKGAVFAPTDVTNELDVDSALDIAESHGALRVLVHCAGRGGDRLRILDREGRPSSLQSFEEVLRVNLLGTYNVLRLSAARMSNNEPVEDERGACVLTASIAAFEGQIGQSAYAASKAGVHALTIVAARDLAVRKIRVNTIAPGVFETPMLGRLETDMRDGLANSVPFPKRLGEPDDYAQLALCLIGNRYMNGETVRIDGALRMAPK